LVKLLHHLRHPTSCLTIRRPGEAEEAGAMTLTAMEELPGGTTVAELQAVLRRELGRPRLDLDEVRCSPVDHAITAPSTESLTFVHVVGHDGEPLELRLVAKCLQSALAGLPPEIPAADRERIAAAIPWRLEAEIYTGDTAGRMPPGLRLPRLYAATEHPGDRITLWLEDVDPLQTAWTDADLARAGTALGRLTVRRADQVLPPLPGKPFLAHLLDEGLRGWAIPQLARDDLWAYPAFAQPEVAALRADLLDLAAQVGELYAGLSAVPWQPAHGDPTPMNLLRPRSDPDGFVLIDWGTASPGPVGWDVVPLVFGPAENGTLPATDLAGRLAVALPAFESGLAEEGVVLPEGAVASALRAAALIRYPFNSLPLGEFVSGGPVTDELLAHARRKAAFIRAVLDACR
jgi:hypothetical protein